MHRGGWRARVEGGQLPRELETSVRELEQNIQWHRIMQTELAAGLLRTPSTPLPPPLGQVAGRPGPAAATEGEEGAAEEGAEAEPPPGLPRAALRVLLLLREMGVSRYDPGVALQLLEVASRL